MISDNPGRSLEIGFLVLTNFTMTPFAALIDVFRLAADDADKSRPIRIRWTVIGNSLEPIRASNGIPIAPQATLGDPARFDYLIVCGGVLKRDGRADPIIEEYVKMAVAAGVEIVGVCTAVFLIAQSGVLDDRQACLSWFHLSEFRALFPQVKADASKTFAIDDRIITCAGGTGAIDVGAFIVERHFGRPLARKALHILVHEAPRQIAPTQPLPDLRIDTSDAAVRHALLLMEQSIDTPTSLSNLASRVGLSRRQLERRFQTAFGKGPAAMREHIRLNYANWLTRYSDHTLTEIAERCGFADSSHFAHRFRNLFGHSPSSVRNAAIAHRDGRVATRERPSLD